MVSGESRDITIAHQNCLVEMWNVDCGLLWLAVGRQLMVNVTRKFVIEFWLQVKCEQLSVYWYQKSKVTSTVPKSYLLQY